MAQVAAAAHTPFIAAAAPSVMQMDSWAELANPRDLTRIFQTPEYTAWRSLRDGEDTRYLGLCLPRFLARLPYGARTDPTEGFDFEEEVEGADGRRYLWTNAAYAMAANIARAFEPYAWCVRIRGVDTGGAVEGLPVLDLPDRRRRCRPALLDRDRAERAARGGAVAQRLHPAGASQGFRFRGVHRRAVAAEAAGIRRPGGHRERRHLLAPALPVRLLPVRALSEVHGARQGRRLDESQPVAGLAAGAGCTAMSTACPTNSDEEWKATHPLIEADVALEGKDDAPGSYDARILPAPAFPDGRPDRLAAPGVAGACAMIMAARRTAW